jgi:hypothetical protein
MLYVLYVTVAIALVCALVRIRGAISLKTAVLASSAVLLVTVMTLEFPVIENGIGTLYVATLNIAIAIALTVGYCIRVRREEHEASTSKKATIAAAIINTCWARIETPSHATTVQVGQAAGASGSFFCSGGTIIVCKDIALIDVNGAEVGIDLAHWAMARDVDHLGMGTIMATPLVFECIAVIGILVALVSLLRKRTHSIAPPAHGVYRDLHVEKQAPKKKQRTIDAGLLSCILLAIPLLMTSVAPRLTPPRPISTSQR